MTPIYSYQGEWLLVNGEKSLFCENALPEQMQNLVKKYQENANFSLNFFVEKEWEKVRFRRNELLKETDWTTLTDVEPKPNKQSWIIYRQQLRDITKTYSSPSDVVWPQPPKH